MFELFSTWSQLLRFKINAHIMFLTITWFHVGIYLRSPHRCFRILPRIETKAEPFHKGGAIKKYDASIIRRNLPPSMTHYLHASLCPYFLNKETESAMKKTTGKKHTFIKRSLVFCFHFLNFLCEGEF